MSFTAWLFLYVAGLMELAIRYRMSLGGKLTTLVILLPLLSLPLLSLPFLVRLPRRRGVRVVGTVLALICAVAIARALSLDFWDTNRLDLGWLSAGIGFGGLLAVDRYDSADQKLRVAEWLLVSGGWLLMLWNPFGPWLALAPASALVMFRSDGPPAPQTAVTTAGLSPAWLLFWIGMALPKPWWDSDVSGALATALWALAVAGAHLPGVRDLTLPKPLLILSLLPLLYPWMPLWIWAPLLGVLCGWALRRAAGPWHWSAPYALLAGLMLSYGLHSNLQWFGLLVWGAR